MVIGWFGRNNLPRKKQNTAWKNKSISTTTCYEQEICLQFFFPVGGRFFHRLDFYNVQQMAWLDRMAVDVVLSVDCHCLPGAQVPERIFVHHDDLCGGQPLHVLSALF